MWIFEDKGDSFYLFELLVEYFCLICWYDYFLDVVLKGILKVLGVFKVVEYLGLKLENILVFGDEFNDLEFFDYVGLVVVMGVLYLEV